MADDSYRPLGMTDAEAAKYDVPAEGIPPWLAASVGTWLSDAFQPNGYADADLLRQAERMLRIAFVWEHGPRGALDSLLTTADSDHGFCLRLIDYALHQLRWAYDSEAIKELTVALEQGGSAWRVAVVNQSENAHSAIFGLEQRVDSTVTTQARDAMSQGKAGAHLHNAWNAAFGASPNPSYAYAQAIKAVEVASAGTIGSDGERATLGTRLGEWLGSESQYRVVLRGEGSSAPGAPTRWDTPGVRIARLMAQLLWTSQDDRHGDPDLAKPITVSQPEAEAAVHLAVLLVQWLRSGALARSSSAA